jgi:hypothetical protein
VPARTAFAQAEGSAVAARRSKYLIIVVRFEQTACHPRDRGEFPIGIARRRCRDEAWHTIWHRVWPAYRRYSRDDAAARPSSLANVSALTCGRNGNGEDDAVDTPKRAGGAKRTRREGHQDASAPVRFSGLLGGPHDSSFKTISYLLLESRASRNGIPFCEQIVASRFRSSSAIRAPA